MMLVLETDIDKKDPIRSPRIPLSRLKLFLTSVPPL